MDAEATLNHRFTLGDRLGWIFLSLEFLMMNLDDWNAFVCGRRFRARRETEDVCAGGPIRYLARSQKMIFLYRSCCFTLATPTRICLVNFCARLPFYPGSQPFV